MSAEPGFKIKVKLRSDGNWGMYCPMCHGFGGYIGAYSDREAAMSYAASHHRQGSHRSVYFAGMGLFDDW